MYRGECEILWIEEKDDTVEQEDLQKKTKAIELYLSSTKKRQPTLMIRLTKRVSE